MTLDVAKLFGIITFFFFTKEQTDSKRYGHLEQKDSYFYKVQYS